jgi:hypothetical protein
MTVPVTSVEAREPEMATGQEISATGKARSLEAGAGTVSRPMMGANAGSTPAPTLFPAEVTMQATCDDLKPLRVRVSLYQGEAEEPIAEASLTLEAARDLLRDLEEAIADAVKHADTVREQAVPS